MLNYPIYRIAESSQAASTRIAVSAVIAKLIDSTAKRPVQESGLRTSSGAPPTQIAAGSAFSSTIKVKALPPVTDTAVLMANLKVLLIPSRILTVIDVSKSMDRLVPGSNLSRIQLAAAASRSAGDLMSDTWSVGVWIFANDLTPKHVPYVPVIAVQPLGSKDPGSNDSHRTQIYNSLAGMRQGLDASGTSLYSTTLAAYKAMSDSYDATQINTVVLITDGKDTTFLNDATAQRNLLAETIAKLKVLKNDRKPVGLIAIGLSPEADMKGLQKMVDAVDGSAYAANSPKELQKVLVEALAKRA
jgi:hypothetical protein